MLHKAVAAQLPSSDPVTLSVPIPGTFVGRVIIGTRSKASVANKLRSQRVLGLETVTKAMLDYAPENTRPEAIDLYVVTPLDLDMPDWFTSIEVLTEGVRQGFKLLSTHDAFVVRCEWSGYNHPHVQAASIPCINHGLILSGERQYRSIYAKPWDSVPRNTLCAPWLFAR